MPDTAIQLIAVVESMGSAYKLGEFQELLHTPLNRHKLLILDHEEWIEVSDIEPDNRPLVEHVMRSLGGKTANLPA